VRPGDELLVWYGDQLALDLGVPLLTPANITGNVFIHSHDHRFCIYTRKKTVSSIQNRGRTDRPTVLPRYHAHARWTSPLPLVSAAPPRMPRRASMQLMT